jgi:hypothetical protein
MSSVIVLEDTMWACILRTSDITGVAINYQIDERHGRLRYAPFRGLDLRIQLVYTGKSVNPSGRMSYTMIKLALDQSFDREPPTSEAAAAAAQYRR